LRTAYFDCFAGASGDMVLGAMIDAGMPPEDLREELAKLNLPHFSVTTEKAVKKGIGGTQVHVHIDGPEAYQHRNLSHIYNLIEQSGLALSIQENSKAIFLRLAEAEAQVHQTDIDSIHFHEVGAVDAIVDIVGSVIGISLLGIQKIVCSPIHTGFGAIESAHGSLPVPAPATAALMKEKPVYSTSVKGELLTPTGAAILSTLSSAFGPMPEMTVRQIGYGSGTADLEIPNFLRLFIGDTEGKEEKDEKESVVLVETNIDDMNPQLYDYLFDRLFDEGAVDVFLTPVQMKKNRPGTVLSVLCPPDLRQKLTETLLKEATTIGVRWRTENRVTAQRRIEKIDTDYGAIQVKVARYDGKIINISPEYDDCKRAATQYNIPLKKVLEDVRSMTLQHIHHIKDFPGSA